MARDMVLLREPRIQPPPLVGRLLEFKGTWSEEPTPLELPQVSALTNKINFLKQKGLTGVCVAAHWLARRVQPLKKQVHLGWEYSGSQDLTRETQENITPELLAKHLGEIFQDTSSWPTDEQVRFYDIRVERDPVRRPNRSTSFSSLKILRLNCLNAGFRQLHFTNSRL
jgi:hypothetical protein